ncbi:TMV resistance protein N [Prunus persica]|uniref:TMV resistance protein N n=1 Tax=Prunus persica TaxID=3760 RepID=UPI0009AB66B7|nr:TMV resistance protein N [Prunus persica]
MALPPHSYDVFLSFRGEDTRKTFTDHLYTAFVNAGFRTFRDDDELERGEDIKPELQRAIQQSRSSVIVFSKNYASSRWCLDELVMILERKRTSDHVVLPVFYDVDPSQVRKPTASLATAFVKNGSLKVKVEKWRAALTEVADLAGMVLQNQADGHESKFIKKIVKVIEGKLSRTAFNVAPHLIGIHSRVRDINLWLHDGSTKVRVLLIYGMRGIGKTTLAKFVYNINFKRYKGSSFLENIKEHSKQTNGLVQIQKKLLSDVLNGKRVKVGNISEGIIKIEDALSSKRVLLVFDDVDHVEQLDAVLRMQGQFCPGSKIIITTSHAALLNASHQAIKVHNLETFNSNESLELFSWHAFGQDHPEKDYMELSERVVNLSGGLPLALKILGSSLSGKSTVVWESALNKLEAIPNGEILNKLRISYDSLQDQHDRSLFLHIACFFIGMEKDVIVRILDSCGFYTIVGIQNLIDRCLVTVDEYNKVRMHYMIRDMGRGIVHLESKEPGERSRLWNHKDSFKVLKEKNGTQTIEGLVLNMGMHPAYCTPSRNSNEVTLETDAFASMHKLRLLQLSHVRLIGRYKEFPTKLRWLCWNEFPFDYLPNDLTLESLVVLEMCYSSLRQVWKGKKYLPSLKFLNLSNSHRLTSTPDFSHVPNVESLILKDCTNLVDVESIGDLKKLFYLNMEDCKNIRKLPKNIFMLKFLETLIISGCSSLNEFPAEMGKMESLKVLQGDGVPIYRLLTTIVEVKLQPRKNPETYWTSYLPCNLVELSLSDCNLSDYDFPRGFGNLFSLQRLNLSCNPISSLPDCIRGLKRLEELSFSQCTRLESLRGLPPVAELIVNGCTSLETVAFQSMSYQPKIILDESNYKLVEIEHYFKLEHIERVDERMINLLSLGKLKSTETIMMDSTLHVFKTWMKSRMHPIQGLNEYGIFSTFLPGNEVPGRFSRRSSTQSSISLTVPIRGHLKIQGLNVFSVYAKSNSDSPKNINANVESIPNPLVTAVKVSNENGKNLKWVYVPSFFAVPGDGKDMVKEYGIQVVYEQEKKMSTPEDRIDTSQSNMVLQDDYEAADVISFPIDALFSPSVIAGDFSESDKVMSGTYFLSNRPEEIVVYRWLWFDDFVRDVEENIGERTDVENLEEEHDGDTKFGDNGSTSRQREGGKAFNFGWNYVVSIFTTTKKIIWKATPDNFRCGGTEGY